MSLTDSAVSGCRWRKARRSANDGACVEAVFVNGQLAVRDSKNPSGSQLRFPVRSWSDFTSAVKGDGPVRESVK